MNIFEKNLIQNSFSSVLLDPNNKKIEIFLKHSNYAKVYQDNLRAGLQYFTPKLWQRLLDKTQECSLYFVEAKNGLLEIPILKKLIQQRGSMKEFHCTCQGVSAVMREEFRQGAMDGELKNLNIEYQVVHFQEPLYVEPRAHLVVAPYEWLDILSWKNTPREHNSLVKFRNSLYHGGAGLIVLPYRACDRFVLLQKLKLATLIVGEEVVEELCDLEIRHQAYIVATTINTECCFQRGRFRPTQEGEQLLSYLLQTEWRKLSERAKKNVGEKITELRAHYGQPKMILQHLFLWIFPGTPHERDLEKEEKFIDVVR